MGNNTLKNDFGISVKPEMKTKIMSELELEKIHQATLTILNKAGVKFPSEKALNIFEKAGATVDHAEQIVKIPPEFLMSSLSNAPKKYCMASRGSENLDLYLDGTKSYCGGGGTGNSVMNIATGMKRSSTKKDVETTALICDYIEDINFYWPIVSATDTPPATMPLHEIEASFTHTEKHVHIVTCVEERAARYAVEMARVVAGGSQNMKRRPPLSLIVSPISPLGQEAGALDAALVFAEAGLPVGFATMPSICATGPASLAGTLVTGNAEILSGICLIQLAFPGAPVFYPFFSMTINPHSAESVTSWPLGHLFSSSVAQLGHSYNLPVMSTFLLSDTKDIWSWQTGFESGVGGIQFFSAGTDLCVGIGLMDSATATSHEKIIMDADVVKTIKRILEGFTVNDESLAVEDIIASGPGGNFLETSHTLKNIRELWQPGICCQWSPDKNAFRNPKEVVEERVKWILNNHVPSPLDEKAKSELKRIIESAERELVGN
jgi:trimethylamine--corrinoid protein Co-methyltransferase